MQGRQGGREAGLGLSRWVGLDKRKPGFLLPKRGRPASSLMLVLMMGRFAVGSRGRCPDTPGQVPLRAVRGAEPPGPPKARGGPDARALTDRHVLCSEPPRVVVACCACLLVYSGHVKKRCHDSLYRGLNVFCDRFYSLWYRGANSQCDTESGKPMGEKVTLI